jgi:hypothetical protein
MMRSIACSQRSKIRRRHGQAPHRFRDKEVLVTRKEALPDFKYGLACIFSRAIRHLRAGKQSCRSDLGIARAMEMDILDLRRDAQHPGMHILAIQKGALGNGTVRKAGAISSQCTLDRLCKLAIERGIVGRPDAEATAAIDDGRKSVRAEKVKLR